MADPSQRRSAQDLHGVLLAAERYYKDQLRKAPEAIAYLKSRGLTGAVAGKFGLGYAPNDRDGLLQAMNAGAAPISSRTLLEAGLISRNDQGREYDRFRRRIMFPVRDAKGRTIAFGGRLFGDGQGPKYLNSPETPLFHKSRELYGLFEALRPARRLDALIVVEGYLDVIALAQAGIPNAVATLGTATGEEHYRRLYGCTDEVICCFDGDPAGLRASWKALESALGCLSAGRRLKFMLLPDGEDPDTLVRRQGADEFRRRMAEATPAAEHLFTGLRRGLDLSTIDDRARLADLAAPYMERTPANSASQRMMRDQLRALTGIDKRPVDSSVAPRPAPPRAAHELDDDGPPAP